MRIRACSYVVQWNRKCSRSIEIGNEQYLSRLANMSECRAGKYLKALLKAVKSGRTDYENLLPMTISLER